MSIEGQPQGRRGNGWFAPILAGANIRDRALAVASALVAIVLTATACGYLIGGLGAVPLIVAPLGASAVLVFAIPSSPLAQPWPVIGGNTISAAVGLACAQAIGDPAIAAGAAVALAIAVMSLTRSLHPPGGAVALTAVLGGPAVAEAGLLFPLMPVAVNSFVLILLAVPLSRLLGRRYPQARPAVVENSHGTRDPAPTARAGVTPSDIDFALEELDQAFDIDRGDLERVLRRAQSAALVRTHGGVTCGSIMSRDVIFVGPDATDDQALALLVSHNIRTLPVLDVAGRVMGTVGLRELASRRPSNDHPQAGERRVGDIISPAPTAAEDDPALGLLPLLLDGRSHAVVIADADSRLSGLITQTDLLATLAALQPTGVPAAKAANDSVKDFGKRPVSGLRRFG